MLSRNWTRKLNQPNPRLKEELKARRRLLLRPLAKLPKVERNQLNLPKLLRRLLKRSLNTLPANLLKRRKELLKKADLQPLRDQLVRNRPPLCHHQVERNPRLPLIWWPWTSSRNISTGTRKRRVARVALVVRFSEREAPVRPQLLQARVLPEERDPQNDEINEAVIEVKKL
jgi:hypothetical protein